MPPLIPVKRIKAKPAKPSKRAERLPRAVGYLKEAYGRHYNPDTVMPVEWELLALGAIDYYEDEEIKTRLSTMREMLACWLWYQVKMKLSPADAGAEILRVIDQAETEGQFKAGDTEPNTSKGERAVAEIIRTLREHAKAVGVKS